MGKFFIHQAIDGSWHVVFRSVKGELISVEQCPTKATAENACADRNRHRDKLRATA